MGNIKTDSRKIVPGDTFIAIKGVDIDGHDYIDKAIENGASKIIAQKGLYSVETLIVNDTKEYLATYLSDTYKQTLKDIKFVGITGTNGKTTSCYLAYKLLNLLGKKCAYIGTIGFYIEQEIVQLNNTTPGIMDLYEMFLKCKERNVEVIVMEVSSHALELGRVDKILFDIVSFTNLTKEHTDFHLTMEKYLKAKQKLFCKVKENGYAIINGDDPYYKDFIFEKNNNIIYGVNEDSKYRIIDYNLEIDSSTFNMIYENKNYNIVINMPGKYNIYNFINAVIIVRQIGFGLDNILQYSSVLQAPPGRMDNVKYGDSVIIVDYAHTPDAVLNVLNSAHSFNAGKIITLIGCGGDRDKTKRPIMGDLATKLSDYVIFTNDNPRTEDPKDIMNDITKDLEVSNFEIIYDRQLAIEKGINMLKQNDVLLILGKGHENYQIIGHEKHYHDDKESVLKYIESIK